MPPANVLTVCGVFGNLTDDDVARTIAALPGLLAAGGLVVWTRGVQDRDRTPEIRAEFAANGFTEVSFASTAQGAFRVGVHRLTAGTGGSGRRDAEDRMFTFR